MIKSKQIVICYTRTFSSAVKTICCFFFFFYYGAEELCNGKQFIACKTHWPLQTKMKNAWRFFFVFCDLRESSLLPSALRTAAIRYCAMSRGDDRAKDLLHIGWLYVWDAPLHCYRLLYSVYGLVQLGSWAISYTLLMARSTMLVVHIRDNNNWYDMCVGLCVRALALITVTVASASPHRQCESYLHKYAECLWP